MTDIVKILRFYDRPLTDLAADEIERLRAELETERRLSFRNQVAQLEAERDAAVKALKRIKETGVFVGAIAQEMMDAAIDAAKEEA